MTPAGIAPTVVAHAVPPSWAGLVLAGGVMTWIATGDFLRRSVTEQRSLRLFAVVALAGTTFQVFHFAEHVLQAAYWVVHPGDAPWLTPWAVAGRDALASVTDGRGGTGNELLHLVGNLIFLGAVAAARALHAHSHATIGGLERRRWLRRALWLQGLHVGEHVTLTVTWLLTGSAVGASNLFGLLEPGTAVASGTRVWVHFTLNLVATLFALRGMSKPRATAGRAFALTG